MGDRLLVEMEISEISHTLGAVGMKIGSLVFATDQGLGILAKSFFDNGIITDVLVVRHGRRTSHHKEWYPDATFINMGHAGITYAQRFIAQMDAMLFFETPFDWKLIDYCKKVGVTAILMPMYECMPATLPSQPDYFICPSELDLQCYPDRSIHLPIPVDVKWKKRELAHTFVHNAGHGGLMGRNGTKELLQAIPLCKSSAKFIIRTQDERLVGKFGEFNNVDVQTGTIPYEELWNKGDVFVFPEKFNGLSLPLQEAYASGMAVMATDRFPINEWLPKGLLIPSHEHRENRISPRYRLFDEAIVDPVEIAKKIDWLYGQDISAYSDMGRQYGVENSWDVLGCVYSNVIEKMADGSFSVGRQYAPQHG